MLEVSAVTHRGLRELAFALAPLVEEQRRAARDAADEAPRPVIRPRPVGEVNQVSVEPCQFEGRTVYQVRGDKPERWVKQTDFTNDEAIGYLADRLATIGVEDQLAQAGANAGDTVVIGPLEGGVIFDWEPSLTTGPELLGSRGTDNRVDALKRRTNRERREEYRAAMDAKAAARDELWTERESGVWTDPSTEDDRA